jgi:hypothetical protein
MKTVAIIAPEFSPFSLPPSIRVRFFTNHLKEFGWNPVVFSVEPEFIEDAPDWEFARMIPNDLEIIRVKALHPKWTRKIAIGDLGIRCLPYMFMELMKFCRKRQPDLLFIPGPPWHTFLVGPRIKKEFNIPYVLDYIDPWVSSWGQDTSFLKKSFWYRQMSLLLEPFAVRNADHITAVSDGTNEGVRVRYPFLKPDQFTSIPYGGEPGDFDYLRKNPRPNPYWDKNDNYFHISYVGAMLPKAYGTLRTLFGAILQLRKHAPDLFKRLRLHFIGTTYDPNPERGIVMPVARENGLDSIVSEHPRRIPYMDAINVLCQSDALFGMGTSEPHYTASKIFPFILAGRPILAMYHEASSVVEILKRVRTGFVITYSDAAPVETKRDLILEQLMLLLKKPSNGALPFDLRGFEDFTAHTMTRSLAAVFDRVVAANTVHSLTQ